MKEKVYGFIQFVVLVITELPPAEKDGNVPKAQKLLPIEG